MGGYNIRAFLIKFMKPKTIFLLSIFLLSLLVSACHTNRHTYGPKKKKKKRNCDCSEFSLLKQKETLHKTAFNFLDTDNADLL